MKYVLLFVDTEQFAADLDAESALMTAGPGERMTRCGSSIMCVSLPVG